MYRITNIKPIVMKKKSYPTVVSHAITGTYTGNHYLSISNGKRAMFLAQLSQINVLFLMCLYLFAANAIWIKETQKSVTFSLID